VRHYNLAFTGLLVSWIMKYADTIVKVGRCRLTLSKPALKARLVSALEAKM
jgi:hypothetical protein